MGDDQLVTLTLLGALSTHKITSGEISSQISRFESPGLAKANSLAVNSIYVVVGGLDSSNKGVFFTWEVEVLGRSQDTLVEKLADELSEVTL